MKNMVDIEVIFSEKYLDPAVKIYTQSNTRQVENIVYAIENASDNDFPQIAGYLDDKIVFISQRDIIRVHTEGRRVLVQTEDGSYVVRKTLGGIEEDLNSERFIRISQSEIVNLYKVKCFDINVAGTIGVEFDNGMKSWVSRSRVKDIKNKLKDILR